MEFKIKEYDLKFIIDKEVILNHGVNISLTPTPPTTKEDFYWIESITYDPLGFMYKLDGVEERFHSGGLYPLLPVIVSSDFLNIGDSFYYNGEIHEALAIYFDEEEEKWMIIDEENNIHDEADVYKLIASPEQIGWVYNEGPPHDHNYNWVDSRFLESVNNRLFINCVKDNFKITIVVEEECITGGEECRGELKLIPQLHEGKVIIDGYGLLKKSSSVFVY